MIYLIANWKMNPTSITEAKKLASGVERGISKLRNRKNLEIVLCPPFPYLKGISYQLKVSQFGAQNCHFEDSGALTGEVSAKMLKDLGCSYVIVGHSERRAMGEDDIVINKKLKAVLKHGMRPILAIGEKARDSFDKHGRWTAEVDPVVGAQVRAALNGVSAARVKKVIVAYEPVWAIGTGNAAHPNDVFAVRIFIQKVLRDLYTASVQKSIPIIYGGSTNRKNIAAFICESHMEGALVGGASLAVTEFVNMAQEIIEA